MKTPNQCRHLEMRSSAPPQQHEDFNTLGGDATGHSAVDDPLLTLAEVAMELRCSKGHASKIVAGKIRTLSPLRAIRLVLDQLFGAVRLKSGRWRMNPNPRPAILNPPEIPRIDA
jgi:hypothetical protein